jgi:hypothetical protein
MGKFMTGHFELNLMDGVHTIGDQHWNTIHWILLELEQIFDLPFVIVFRA